LTKVNLNLLWDSTFLISSLIKLTSLTPSTTILKPKGEVGADYALIKEVRQDIENIQLLEKLQNFTIVSQHLNDDSQGKY
jgi:hypothetical protein